MVGTDGVEKAAASKCKTCKLKCPYKADILKQNKTQTCVIPFHKASAIEKKQAAILVVNNEILDAWSTEYLVYLRDMFVEYKDIDSKSVIGQILFNKINEYKNTFKPEPTRNISVKIDMQAQQIAQRVDNFLENKKKKVKVIDIEKKDGKESW